MAGASLRDMARRWGVSKDALQRHKPHVPARVAKARDVELVANADDLLGQLKALQRKALDLLTKAEAVGDYGTALRGISEARKTIELLLEVEGELDRRSVVNIAISPEWLEIRTVLVLALADHPEAAQAVAGALQGIEGGSTS